MGKMPFDSATLPYPSCISSFYSPSVVSANVPSLTAGNASSTMVFPCRCDACVTVGLLDIFQKLLLCDSWSKTSCTSLLLEKGSFRSSVVPTGGSSTQMPGHSSISTDPPDVATASTTQGDGLPDNSQTHFLTGEHCHLMKARVV